VIVVFRAVSALWRSRQRRIDLDILWPVCKREALARYAPDEALDRARAAFAYHAFNDPAWLCLGEEMIVAHIDKLD
jgi:hypothetical protein